jgi:DNA-binding transcriptional ArsR family regulator/uncharacterized protein YndB with AHSA1/START domain
VSEQGGADDTQRLLGALNSSVRREILWLIWDRELAAGEIAQAFKLSPPSISQHLAVLRDGGLVTVVRDGTFRRYRARQDAVAGLGELFTTTDQKWLPNARSAAPLPARTVAVVVAEADAPCDRQTAFRAFTDPVIYSRWAGVPVKLVDGQFAMTMEWGLKVRGTYDHVLPPSIIVMTWDFDVDHVPLPGRAQRAYLEITARCDDGSHLEVHQFVREYKHARKMERTWALMLDRFRDNVLDAVDPTVKMSMRRRSRRPTEDAAATVRRAAPPSRPRRT